MKDLTARDYDEARQLILEAQSHMMEALVALRDYVKLTGDRNTEAYIVDQLAIMTSEEHGYATHDKNLDDVLKELADAQPPDEEDEDGQPVEPYYDWNGEQYTASELVKEGEKEFAAAGLRVGAGSTYHNTCVNLISYETAPETMGASLGTWTAYVNQVDGKWKVSRHGALTG